MNDARNFFLASSFMNHLILAAPAYKYLESEFLLYESLGLGNKDPEESLNKARFARAVLSANQVQA
jgi:hypothetical protein